MQKLNYLMLSLGLISQTAMATCPDVSGTWYCQRDFPKDGSENQLSTITVTTDGMGVSTMTDQSLDENGDPVGSPTVNIMDGAWYSQSNYYGRYVCNEDSIPIKTEFTYNTSDPYSSPDFIGRSEWYPVPLVNPTHLFLRSTFPPGAPTYPEWFGYICTRQ